MHSDQISISEIYLYGSGGCLVVLSNCPSQGTREGLIDTNIVPSRTTILYASKPRHTQQNDKP